MFAVSIQWIWIKGELDGTALLVLVEADLHMKAIWDSFENGRTFLWEANGKRMGFLLVALFNNI